MKRAITLFLILLAAVGIGIWMYKDSGYVLITFQNWSVETTLWILVLAIVLTFIFLNIIARILNNIISIPKLID
jgi:HemY protein